MRRIRPFRLLRRMRRAFAPGVPPVLKRAHRLMEAGKNAEAAELLLVLARQAEEGSGRRAPQLFLHAGRAFYLSGLLEPGRRALKKGFQMLAGFELWNQVHHAGNRAVRELSEIGLEEESTQIAAYLRELSPDQMAQAEPSVNVSVRLPTHCPGCGGPVRPDEVEWYDPSTAECSYCGSPIQGR